MESHTPADPVTMYLKELDTVVPLTADEELLLFQKLDPSEHWNEDQENAVRRLIETHLTLVVKAAEKQVSSGISMLDLIQEGNLALMDAVRAFANKPNGDFSSYATTRIEESIAKLMEKP